MPHLLPVDLTEVLQESLDKDKKDESRSILYCSSDLVGSLRHSMLRAAGAPTKPRSIVEQITLQTGNFWHDHITNALVERGMPVMQEVRLNNWLPDGWGGRADLVFYHPDYQAFVLVDIKTNKGEGMRYIRQTGAKLDHIWQASAYWYALLRMGLPLVSTLGIFYLPKNDTTDAQESISPTLVEVKPIDEDKLEEVMQSRIIATKSYLAEIEHGGLLNRQLAPEQPRVQKMWWSGKTRTFDVKLVPHWSAAYCPFDESLCACSTRGTTKIGHYLVDGSYVPRKGYEEVIPEIKPSGIDLAGRRKDV